MHVVSRLSLHTHVKCLMRSLTGILLWIMGDVYDVQSVIWRQVRMDWWRIVWMMFRWRCRRRPDCCCFRARRGSTISAVWRESLQLRSPVRFIHSHRSLFLQRNTFCLSILNPWTLHPDFTWQTRHAAVFWCLYDAQTRAVTVYRCITVSYRAHLPIYSIAFRI